MTCLLDAATYESRERERQAHAHRLPSLADTSASFLRQEFSGDDPWKGGVRGVENKGIMRTPTADRKAARLRGKDQQDQAGTQGERQAGIKAGALAHSHTKAKQDTRTRKAAHASGFFFPSIFAPDSLRPRHKRAATLLFPISGSSMKHYANIYRRTQVFPCAERNTSCTPWT